MYDYRFNIELPYRSKESRIIIISMKKCRFFFVIFF